jgi:hypothetical protein
MDGAETLEISVWGRKDPLYEHTNMWLRSDTVENILEWRL